MTEPTMHTDADGDREWIVNDLLHRLDGPAVEYANGTREWWVHGVRHRLDGPAVERADGGRQWWVHGKRHRIDGPAIERPDGRREWYVNGVHITRYVPLYIRQGMTDADAITAALIALEREGEP